MTICANYSPPDLYLFILVTLRDHESKDLTSAVRWRVRDVVGTRISCQGALRVLRTTYKQAGFPECYFRSAFDMVWRKGLIRFAQCSVEDIQNYRERQTYLDGSDLCYRQHVVLTDLGKVYAEVYAEDDYDYHEAVVERRGVIVLPPGRLSELPDVLPTFEEMAMRRPKEDKL